MSTEPAATVPAVPATAELLTGAQLLADLPAVNEKAVAAVSGTAVAAPTSTPAGVPSKFPPDAAGRAFDPVRFRANPDGSPFLNGKKLFMPRGGRKPAGFATAPSAPVDTGSTIPADLPGLTAGPLSSPSPGVSPALASTGGPALPTISLEAHENSAEAWLQGGYAIADGVFGGKGEWSPEDASEHSTLKAAFVAWRKAQNPEPLAPGGGFAMAVVGYVLKRLFKPNTAKRLGTWFPWLGSLLGVEPEKPAESDKGKKPEAPAVPVPQHQNTSTDIA